MHVVYSIPRLSCNYYDTQAPDRSPGSGFEHHYSCDFQPASHFCCSGTVAVVCMADCEVLRLAAGGLALQLYPVHLRHHRLPLRDREPVLSGQDAYIGRLLISLKVLVSDCTPVRTKYLLTRNAGSRKPLATAAVRPQLYAVMIRNLTHQTWRCPCFWSVCSTDLLAESVSSIDMLGNTCTNLTACSSCTWQSRGWCSGEVAF
jgi:hypothetical protein